MRYGFSSVCALLFGLLTGCVNPYPLPLDEPSENDSVLQPKAAVIDSKGVVVAAARTQREVNPDRPGGLGSALATPSTQHDLKVNLLIYSDHYQWVHDKLTGAKNATTDLTLSGGIIGVVGGLISSSTTVYTGSALAAGSSIYGQRYEFLIQATNYRKASAAMICMLRIISPLDETRGLSPEGISSGAQKTDEIRQKLYLAQSAVVLKDPDLTQLRKSLQDTKDAEENKTKADKARNYAPFVTGSFMAPEDEALVLAKLDECVSTF